MTSLDFVPFEPDGDYIKPIVEGLSAKFSTEVYGDKWHLSFSEARSQADGSFRSRLSAVDHYAMTNVEEDIVLPAALDVNDGHIRIVTEHEPEAYQGKHKNRVIISSTVLAAMGAAGISAAVAFALHHNKQK